MDSPKETELLSKENMMLRALLGKGVVQHDSLAVLESQNTRSRIEQSVLRSELEEMRLRFDELQGQLQSCRRQIEDLTDINHTLVEEVEHLQHRETTFEQAEADASQPGEIK